MGPMSSPSKAKDLYLKVREDGFSEAYRAMRNFIRWEYASRYSSQPHLKAKVLDYTMSLNLSDSGISRELAMSSVRERLSTEIVQSETDDGMTVLDIGGNIGYYTLIFADAVGPEGSVFAVEPDKRNLGLLNENVTENGFADRVTTMNKAISSDSTQKYLKKSEKHNLHTVVDVEPTHGDYNTIECTTVDKFSSEFEPPDFVRMDIEGHELHVFRGMKSIIKECDSMKILFEVHDGYPEEMEEQISYLIENGFRPKYVTASGDRPEFFQSHGYSPVKVIQDGYHRRGLYRDIDSEHTVDIVCGPTRTRDILLVKSD